MSPSEPGRRPDDEVLADTVDHLALNRLLGRYADVVTRRAWPELDELFLPDAEVRIDTVTREAFTVTGPDALGAFIGSAIERFDFFEFVVLNQLVSLRVGGDPDRAASRVYMCEQRRDLDGGWSTAYGLYLDEHRRVDGRWWFSARSYRSLGRTGADGGAFGLPDLGPLPDAGS